jgi:hypothetical protein
MTPLNIYISTSNKYHYCLQPFAFLFNKFWSDKVNVTFLGYKYPEFDLPSNFSFTSLGNQNGPEYYSSDLRRFFESIDDTQFIYTMEDQFILDHVNVNLIEKLTDYVVTREKVGRACLTNSIYQTVHNHSAHAGKIHQLYDTTQDPRYVIVELTPNSTWRITCEWSIWDKAYMIKYLQGDMTPWGFEKQSFSEAKNDGYDIIGCKSHVAIEHAEAVRRVKTDVTLDYSYVNNPHIKLDSTIKKELDDYLIQGRVN